MQTEPRKKSAVSSQQFSARASRCSLFISALVLAVLGAVLFGAAPALADDAVPPAASQELLLDESDAAPEPGVDLPDMSTALVKLVVVMLLLLGLLVAGVLVFQRFARGRLKLGRGNRPLRIVDKLALGPKTGICLLNACGRYLVLGVAEKEISVLMEVPMPSEGGEENDFSGALAGLSAEGSDSEKKRVGLKS